MLKHWFISWRKDSSIFNTGKKKVFFFKKIYAVRSSDDQTTFSFSNNMNNDKNNLNNNILIGLAAEKLNKIINKIKQNW